MGRIKVLLADDHALVRAGIRRLLEEDAGIEVVAEADDGYQALERLEGHPVEVDVAVLDIAMPRLNGLDTAREVQKRSPRTQVLLLSMYDDPHFVREAMRAGVAGYLLKHEVADVLTSAVRRVAAGEPAFATPVLREVVACARRSVEAGEEPLLTDRERQVLQLAAEGYTNKEIAALLRLSPETVRNHRASLMRKLDLHSVADLVRYAVKCGLVVPDWAPDDRSPRADRPLP